MTVGTGEDERGCVHESYLDYFVLYFNNFGQSFIYIQMDSLLKAKYF